MWTTLAVGLAAPLAGALLAAPAARAADGDLGHQDGSFAGAGAAPSSDKPQSKLWFNDGLWWADMFDTTSGTWHIFRLNRSTQTWSDTGTRIDDRPDSRGDALWDGTHLYVATNVLAASSASNATGQPSRLYRYSYRTATHTYALDAGFPATINNVSSESLTLDKDSKGVLWATWTQGQAVYVNSSNGTDTSWGTPFALGTTGASGLSSDDISSLAAYGQSKVALMWSNQSTGAFYVATHQDGAARGSWTARAVVSGSSMADDHISIKQFQGDSAGHLYAAVKTSLDLTGNPDAEQTLLLSLDPNTGAWDSTPFGTVGDCHTRPILLIDSTNKVLHMFATAPSSGGCPGSGTPGTIYEKTTPLSNPSFAPGRGTAVIRDTGSAFMNDVTSTKQTLTAQTGMIILASNNLTERYWHADIPLPGAPAATTPAPANKLTTSFTVAPVAKHKLTVKYVATASAPVKTWTWKFGDGKTASGRSAVHAYRKRGTYVVTLTVTTTKGLRATSTRKIVVR